MLEINIDIIKKKYLENQKALFSLRKGIKILDEKLEIIDDFLEELNFPITNETRQMIYTRITSQKDVDIINFMEKNSYSKSEIENKLKTVYFLASSFFYEMQTNIINWIQDENLLPEFYLELIWTYHEVGKVMNSLHLKWQDKIILGQNKYLEENFSSIEEGLKFLEKNNLFEKNDGEKADFSHSSVDFMNNKILTYSQSFPEEVSKISEILKRKIEILENLELENSSEKENYLNFFKSFKTALENTDLENNFKIWAEVDRYFIKNDSIFETGSFFEFYEV